MKILLISSEGSNDIKDIGQFFEKHFNPADEKYTFPFIANDTTLTKLFPHISIPHVVWLYNGKVIAITDGGEISTAHIQQVLQHKPVSFDMKEDVMDFDPSSPLLSKDNGGDDNDGEGRQGKAVADDGRLLFRPSKRTKPTGKRPSNNSEDGKKSKKQRKSQKTVSKLLSFNTEEA